MKILLVGQCTLHWGRMEFGNIGNFYIMEPLVRELLAVFPGAEISTTFQMSKEFQEREGVSVLPMDLYYTFDGLDLDRALKELAIAMLYASSGNLVTTTPYIEAVLGSDLVIDFSGDIWGDNADLLGRDRFFVGLCKDRVAQLLGRPTAMIAGSPGPFADEKNLAFAKEVFANFDLVTNREPISSELLRLNGFANPNMHSFACPAFLFEPRQNLDVDKILHLDNAHGMPTAGFILCGWNFLEGPFDKWPRQDEEYLVFAEAVEYMELELGLRVCLMSHSNGFPLPPEPFKLIHGRDHPVIKQLSSVLLQRGRTKHVFALDEVHDAWTTKAIIGGFDMLVSGRIHAAVAGYSQSVPTVVIDYGHEPKAHKLQGFATVAGQAALVADPAKAGDLRTKIAACWTDRDTIRKGLSEKMVEVRGLVKNNFKALNALVSVEEDVR